MDAAFTFWNGPIFLWFLYIIYDILNNRNRFLFLHRKRKSIRFDCFLNFFSELMQNDLQGIVNLIKLFV